MTPEQEQLQRANTQLGQVIMDKDAEISALRDQNADANNREAELRKQLHKTVKKYQADLQSVSESLKTAESITERQAQEIETLKASKKANPAAKKKPK